ncbi:hypothetical protein NIES2111_52110 [Nostoc sp. NIES-2111]|nr:hypothetical protein NIES2111_52110 [Nostoc sp. NIES-2111]
MAGKDSILTQINIFTPIYPLQISLNIFQFCINEFYQVVTLVNYS